MVFWQDRDCILALRAFDDFVQRIAMNALLFMDINYLKNCIKMKKYLYALNYSPIFVTILRALNSLISIKKLANYTMECLC